MQLSPEEVTSAQPAMSEWLKSVQRNLEVSTMWSLSTSKRGRVTHSANDNTSVTCNGYLQKQSAYLKTFRRRWMVLKSDHKLYSFKSHDKLSVQPTEIIEFLQTQM